MKSIFISSFILLLLCIGCSKSDKTRNAAEEQLQKSVTEWAKNPASAKAENVNTVYSTDSIAVLHLDLTAKNGFGNPITQHMQYVYIALGDSIYDGLLELGTEDVYQDIETWKKTKGGTFYENLDYDTSMKFRAISFINVYGRRVGEKFGINQPNIPVPTKTGNWTLKSGSDKFGDATSHKGLYIMGKGTFSNIITTGSEAFAILCVSDNLVTLGILEYSSHPVNNKGETYKVNIKDSKGVEYPTMKFMNMGSGGAIIPVDYENVTLLFDILKKGGTVSFNVVSDDFNPSTYKFKINVDGYLEALKYIK